MRQGFLAGLTFLCAAAGLAGAEGKVEYKVNRPYFESNKSGLKGDSSYLFFPTRAKFHDVLRLVPPRFGAAKADPVKDDAFADGTVVAVIKRGAAVTTYEVKNVTLSKGGVLTVAYTATAGVPGTATFASPLVISVARKDVKAVEFVENGKPAQKVKTGR